MKRQLLLAFAMLIAVVTKAQIAYSVNGDASPEAGKVYLVDVSNRFGVIDSTTVSKSGQFSMTGTQQQNTVLGLATPDYVMLFINDGTPIEAHLATMELKGSPQNNKLNAYDRELTPIDKDMESTLAKLRSNEYPDELKDSLAAIYLQLVHKKEMRMMEIIRENNDNLVPVAFVGELAYSMDYEQLKEVCNPSNAYYNHPAMTLPKRLLENMAKRAPGTLFKDMTIPDIDGNSRKLSEWIGKGQYVMVDFWASWCGPCRQEMPNVVANYEKYHSKGFEIVGISFDQKADPWKKSVEQMKMKWPQLSDLGGWQSAASGVYGISSIPASILFDPQGKIIAIDLRGEKLGQKLAEIYGF